MNPVKRNMLCGAIAGLAIAFGSAAGAANTDDLKQLKLQQERLQSRDAIENLMGTYALYHFANMYDDARYAALFAQDDDTKVQTSRGVWVGKQAGERMLKYYLQMSGDEGFAGHMHLHPFNTPIIEVAGDNQTAKGAWLSPGAEISVRDGAPTGMNLTVKYAIDFKNENGEWKIWHLRINGVYASDLSGKILALGPPAGGAAPKPFEPNPASLKPDLPQVGEPMYTPTTVQKLNPLPPRPYATWNKSLSYIP